MAEWVEGKQMLAWADKVDLKETSTDILAAQIRSVVSVSDQAFGHVEDILKFIRGGEKSFPENLLVSKDGLFFLWISI